MENIFAPNGRAIARREPAFRTFSLAILGSLRYLGPLGKERGFVCRRTLTFFQTVFHIFGQHNDKELPT
jgi:hypothetical protein